MNSMEVPRRDWYWEDVLSGKLKVKVIWEDPRVLAFYHPQPASRVHAVIIPKKHIASILDQDAVDGTLLESMVRAVQMAAIQTGLDKLGFFVRANAAAPGVTPHMHWHVRSLD